MSRTAAALGATADVPALHRLNDRVIASAFTGVNEVVCTYCLFQVVSAAYQVGNPVVRKEIEDALGHGDPRALSEALLDAADRLPTLNGTLTGYYQTGAFDQCPMRTKRDQCASIAALLDKRGESVDFKDPQTTDRINAAVERATAGKIRDLFAFLPSSTKLVFASTLVFQDKWLSRLTTVKDRFLLTRDRTTVKVPTLINEDHMPFLDSDDGVQGVSMPYEHPAIRLFCFKAREESADIRFLLYQRHYLEMSNATKRLVQVRMPKFDLVSKKYSYIDLMQQMGMETMFRNGLGPQDSLKVDQLVHKAVIQADEHGTSAAGAAGIAIVPTSLGPRPTLLRFDRPFICSLVHQELNQPLFTAYIFDPRSN
ncbi:alpha-1-antiproteinase F-like [Amphibalanus amphitrite]|uniref:alpha-1-antiproteinase F-like n=1 Tax=Amphibalanus amphitrite TaxID=1232801 RepID=UPI001C9235C6|nr:alpha-1-antiproteinase F-like [Amphibalanus amphitrite]